MPSAMPLPSPAARPSVSCRARVAAAPLTVVPTPAVSTAPQRPPVTAPQGPSVPDGADVVLVGGVPGAGKSTAIATVAPDVPDLSVLDPDALRHWFRGHLPAWVAYRWYRPWCHLLHALAVVWTLLLGSVPGRRVVVHDPSTRTRRLRVLHRLAVARGWRPVLCYVDVAPESALAGQRERGRVIDPESFARHCVRWSRLRQEARGGDVGGWPTIVVTRADAADELRRLLLRSASTG